MAVRLPPEEENFRERLDALERDARAAVRYLYTGATINHLAAERAPLAAALDRDAGFWNTLLGALHTASVAALGRIYDVHRNVGSAARLLEHSSKYSTGLFSLLALESRKARVLPAAGAIRFAEHAYVPDANDFESLRAALEARAGLYETLIGPLRDEVAHFDRVALSRHCELSQRVRTADFEQLALFPLSLHRALARLFESGDKPELETPPTDIARLAGQTYLERDMDSWEQYFSTRDAARFLAGLGEEWHPDPAKEEASYEGGDDYDD
jgi:hypothetical protein